MKSEVLMGQLLLEVVHRPSWLGEGVERAHGSSKAYSEVQIFRKEFQYFPSLPLPPSREHNQAMTFLCGSDPITSAPGIINPFMFLFSCATSSTKSALYISQMWRQAGGGEKVFPHYFSFCGSRLKDKMEIHPYSPWWNGHAPDGNAFAHYSSLRYAITCFQ